MNTKLIKIEDTKQIKDEELAEAAQILRDGGLVAFPTETVYGPGGLHSGSRKKAGRGILAGAAHHGISEE